MESLPDIEFQTVNGSRPTLLRALELEEGVRLCTLEYAAGRIEICPGAACPFWEEGRAVCGIERLGLDRRVDLAGGLLEVRGRLERAGSRREEDEARSLFDRLVAAESAA
jgi:hypothetical protein